MTFVGGYTSLLTYNQQSLPQKTYLSYKENETCKSIYSIYQKYVSSPELTGLRLLKQCYQENEIRRVDSQKVISQWSERQ